MVQDSRLTVSELPGCVGQVLAAVFEEAFHVDDVFFVVEQQESQRLVAAPAVFPPQPNGIPAVESFGLGASHDPQLAFDALQAAGQAEPSKQVAEVNVKLIELEGGERPPNEREIESAAEKGCEHLVVRDGGGELVQVLSPDERLHIEAVVEAYDSDLVMPIAAGRLDVEKGQFAAELADRAPVFFRRERTSEEGMVSLGKAGDGLLDPREDEGFLGVRERERRVHVQELFPGLRAHFPDPALGGVSDALDVDEGGSQHGILKDFRLQTLDLRVRGNQSGPKI